VRKSTIRGSLLYLSFAAALALLTMGRGLADDDELKDPFLGQADAIAAGRVTYAGKCYVCHHSAGARGPNLFAQMPAFGLRLSPDEVWQIHAFIKSTDHY
jgi:mono/diheme cytochrome c family protein